MADIYTALKPLLKEIAISKEYSEYDITIEPFNSGSANFTSVLYLAMISCPGKRDLNIFAKVACLNDGMREKINANRMFQTERHFYKVVMKLYQTIQKKYNLTKEHVLTFPEFYGWHVTAGTGKETVLLENLLAGGYLSFDKCKPFDWTYAAKAIEELAKFHSLSFSYEKEYPKEFEKDLCFFQFSNSNQLSESTAGDIWRQIVQRSVQVIEDESVREKIFQFCMEGRELYTKYNMPFNRNVLVHGDYRPCNLLYKIKDDELHIIPVDYQTVHVGSPTLDLIYFVTMATDQEFRANHYDQLMEYYYEYLEAALKRLGIEADEVYPKTMFYEELKKMQPYMLLVGAIVLPLISPPADQAPSASSENCNVIDFSTPLSDLFPERFRGIVDDCIKWEVI